jgi:arylsulfatase A-like enzyme
MVESVPAAPASSRTRRPAAALLLALSLTLPGCLRQAPRPSVVLITIDTLRADHLGCYGYGRDTSPNIDRLAHEGTLFQAVSASLPRTTQSLASILTGRYPKGHGARGLFSPVAATNLMLAEVFKEAGYATAAIVSNMFLRPGQGFEQGFDLYDNPESRWDGDSAEEVTRAALRWMERRPAGKPFFLWVHYLDPHWTYDPSPPFDSRFDPGFRGPFTLYDDLAHGRITKGQVIFDNRLDARQVEHVVALYDGEIARVDAALGPLLDRLRKVPGPLLIALTSDHGESLGEHGYHFAHGEYLYDPTLRIPLIVVLPGSVAPSQRVDALAQNIDIAPTLLALAGIDRLQAVDGRPLLVARPGPTPPGAAPFTPAPGRPFVVAESDYQLIHPENRRFYIQGPSGKWASVSDGRWKIIQIPRPGGEFLELYDLVADPGETRNLVEGGVVPEERAALLRELRRFVDYELGPAGREPAEIDPEQLRRLRSLGYVN